MRTPTLLLRRRRADVRPDDDGFSLIELMIGMVAGVIVIGSTLSLSIRHARLRKTDEERHLALIACRNNLEEMRSVPFATLPSLDGSGFHVPGLDGDPDDGLAPVEGDADGLPGQFSITVDQNSGGETLYLVRARVTWFGAMDNQTFELETLIGKRE